MILRLQLSLLAIFLYSIRYASAVTCHGYNGQNFTSMLICPGSLSCCPATDECLPNRLCHTPGDNNETFSRPACAITSWDTGACPFICHYDEVNNTLPQVSRCSDGSYCCDNDVTCCAKKKGVSLDAKGSPIALVESSTVTSSSMSTSSATSSSALSTPTQSPTLPPALPSPATSTSTSATSPSSLPATTLPPTTKLALSLSLTLTFLALLLLTIHLIQRRRRLSSKPTTPPSPPPNQHPWSLHRHVHVELDGAQAPIMVGTGRVAWEMPGEGKTVWEAATNREAWELPGDSTSGVPVELPGEKYSRYSTPADGRSSRSARSGRSGESMRGWI